MPAMPSRHQRGSACDCSAHDATSISDSPGSTKPSPASSPPSRPRTVVPSQMHISVASGPGSAW